jgi:hypothetical protein
MILFPAKNGLCFIFHYLEESSFLIQGNVCILCLLILAGGLIRGVESREGHKISRGQRLGIIIETIKKKDH